MYLIALLLVSFAAGTGSGWTLVRSDVECGDNKYEKDLGTFQSVDACAEACKKSRYTCTYFIFGKGSKFGRCWDERINDQIRKSECTHWKANEFDFYRLDTGNGWTLLRANVECGNNANEVYLGNWNNVDRCADACRRRDGCTNFIFGRGSKFGKCWDEGITESECTNWKANEFDFYRLDDAPAEEYYYYECEQEPCWHDVAVGSGKPDTAASQVKARKEEVLGTENNRLRKANKALMAALEELSN